MIEVLHLAISLNPGGLERLVVDMTNARNAAAGSTRICCLDRPGELADEVRSKKTKDQTRKTLFSVDADRSRFPWDFQAVRRLRQTINDADSYSGRHAVILHAHNMAAWQYAVLSARGTNAKVVYTQHGANPHVRGVVNRFRAKWQAGRTARIVAVSKATASSMTQLLGIPADRIAVLYNGVAIGGEGRERSEQNQPSLCTSCGGQQAKKATKDGMGRAEIRSKFRIGTDAFVVGSVGRFSPEKNYPLLIEAFAELNLRRPETRLLLVGGGVERTRIQDVADKCKVRDACILPGYQNNAATWIGAMDVFCLSSDSEGTSVALLEAGGQAKPAVVTDVGGNNEVIRDGVDGYVVPAGSKTELAQALDRLVSDPSLCKTMGESFQGRVLQEFSFDQMMSSYEAIYQQVAAEEKQCLYK